MNSPNFIKGNKKVLFFLVLLLIGVVSYFLLGFLNSYLGYYGYDKDKYRRYSLTKEESIERNVFIKTLSYTVSSLIIDDVFIEKGYKWGSSTEKTILLNQQDTFRNNNLNYPYQLIISFKKDQEDQKVYVPQNRVLLEKPFIEDTLYSKVYIRDSLNKLTNQVVIKIWSSSLSAE